MAKYTKYEQETIFNYNQEEKTASCYTCDAALIRKLDRLIEKGEAITVSREGGRMERVSIPEELAESQTAP